MDLLKDLISANAPVGQQDPVSSFIAGGNAAQAQTKANIENVNARYQQELTFRLQKAIQESIGDNGMPDPNKMRQAGQKYGISAQMVNYAIDTIPKVWKSATDVAGNKKNIQTQTVGGEASLADSWATQSAGGQKSAATQSSTTATAVPTAAAPATPATQPNPLDTNAAAFGKRASAWGSGSPLTASIQKEIGLTGKDADGTWGPKTQAAYRSYLTAHPNAGVINGLRPGQMQFINDTTASAGAAESTQPTPAVQASPDGSAQPTNVPLAVDGVQTPAPNALPGANTPDQAAADAQAQVEADLADKSFFGRVNAMKPTPNMSPELDTDGSNPIQVSDMTPATKAAMIRQLQRNARFGTTVTDADLQATLDKDYDIYVTHGVAIPQQQMYLDKDRNPDIGAYNQAVADYPVKRAAAMKAYLDKEGGIFGINFDQHLRSQANNRANQQNTRDAIDFGQKQASVTALRKINLNADEGTKVAINALLANRDAILGAQDEVRSLMAKGDKISIDQLNSEMAVVTKAITRSSGATTQEAENQLLSSLRANKALGAIARESSSIKEFGANFLKAKLGAQERREYLKLALASLQAELDHGQNTKNLNQWKIDKNAPIGTIDGWASKPAHGKKSSSGASTSAPKVGQKNAEGKVWTGKRWL